MIPNSETRKIIIEPLTFDNANSQCNMVIRPLKARSAHIEEWIQDTINIESHNYDDDCVEELISKGLKKNQNVRNNPNRRPPPCGVCRRCSKDYIGPMNTDEVGTDRRQEVMRKAVYSMVPFESLPLMHLPSLLLYLSTRVTQLTQ
ncbi:hypothetical protein STEG23_038198 [Scotinomys teguina]